MSGKHENTKVVKEIVMQDLSPKMKARLLEAQSPAYQCGVLRERRLKPAPDQAN